ncbi:hypothetical protein CHELA1G2_14035 [Hyphomicrobiales bacterium]|nr:hypothetical protein CHELA1G2_14035 [Hyphomicrobiales bacterium]
MAWPVYGPRAFSTIVNSATRLENAESGEPPKRFAQP